MPEVHASAIVEKSVALADDTIVGPGCVLEGDVTVGPGCRLLGRVYLVGPLTMGAGNIVYPGACLGFAPQSVAYDPQEPGRGLMIGVYDPGSYWADLGTEQKIVDAEEAFPKTRIFR